MCPPSLDDLPTLATLTPTGDDLIPVYDLTGNGGSKVRKVSVNQLSGLSAADIGTASTGTSFTISARVTQSTNSAAVAGTLPAATGVLREAIIVNTGTSLGAITMSSTSTIVGSVTLAIGTSGRFLSDGTSWYRVS